MRFLIPVAACAFAVCMLAACGGGGGSATVTAVRSIHGSGFVFKAPADWSVSRSEHSVRATAALSSPELVSVSVFPLLHPYRPALFGAVTHELDRDARQLAGGLGGSVTSSSTVVVAGMRARQYEVTYKSGGHELRQRITFVLKDRTEFQLLCRWSGSEPSACNRLQQSFTPT